MSIFGRVGLIKQKKLFSHGLETGDPCPLLIGILESQITSVMRTGKKSIASSFGIETGKDFVGTTRPVALKLILSASDELF